MRKSIPNLLVHNSELFTHFEGNKDLPVSQTWISDIVHDEPFEKEHDGYVTYMNFSLQTSHNTREISQ